MWNVLCHCAVRNHHGGLGQERQPLLEKRGQAKRGQREGWDLNKKVEASLLEEVMCQQRLQRNEGTYHTKTCAKVRGRNELGEKDKWPMWQSHVQGKQRDTQPGAGALSTQATHLGSPRTSSTAVWVLNGQSLHINKLTSE